VENNNKNNKTNKSNNAGHVMEIEENKKQIERLKHTSLLCGPHVSKLVATSGRVSNMQPGV